MEDIIWKFPLIGSKIFDNLSNQNLTKCKKICRSWYYFIINERFYKVRVHFEMLQKNNENFGITPLHKAAELGHFSECKSIIDHVESKNPHSNDLTTPLHLAAKNGHSKICHLIIKNIREKKNTLDGYGMTPLHYAAENGHFEICDTIIKNVEEKNPQG